MEAKQFAGSVTDLMSTMPACSQDRMAWSYWHCFVVDSKNDSVRQTKAFLSFVLKCIQGSSLPHMDTLKKNLFFTCVVFKMELARSKSWRSVDNLLAQKQATKPNKNLPRQQGYFEDNRDFFLKITGILWRQQGYCNDNRDVLLRSKEWRNTCGPVCTRQQRYCERMKQHSCDPFSAAKNL